jgi:hypothetical protein
MTISINYLTKVIGVPQADLSALGGGLYELNANDFRNTLKNLEDSEDGIAFAQTLRHATEATLSGVTYARQLEIINGYTIDFQNTGVPYIVKVTGANHNLGDVTNFDGGMSMIIGNSAGLQAVNTGGTVAPSQQQIRDAMALATAETPAAGSIDDKIVAVKNKTDQLTFTVPGEVDSNITSVNETPVGGTGQPGDPWGP